MSVQASQSGADTLAVSNQPHDEEISLSESGGHDEFSENESASPPQSTEVVASTVGKDFIQYRDARTGHPWCNQDRLFLDCCSRHDLGMFPHKPSADRC